MRLRGKQQIDVIEDKIWLPRSVHRRRHHVDGRVLELTHRLVVSSGFDHETDQRERIEHRRAL